MEEILFMTVGTGLGSKVGATESLAHGLLTSIMDVSPDFIVFFGSKDSVKTVDSIKDQYFKKNNKKLEKYNFVQLNDINNLSNCFETIEKELLKYDSTDIIKCDYTSGTKTMSVAVAICATIYNKVLVLVSGTRDETNLVCQGTEEQMRQNLFRVYDKLTLDKVKEFFNNNRFESAKTFLDEIKILDNKKIYSDLIEFYNHWDKFNHEEVASIDFSKESLENFPEMKLQIQNNLKSLNIINLKEKIEGNKTKNEHKLRCYYVLADILNNADRRAIEGKYDDAIARLYRSLELIAQIKLKKGYHLKTSNIDIEKVKKNCTDAQYINSLKQKKAYNNIKLGLNEAFKLLNMMNNDLGNEFKKSEKKIKNILSHRNMSILAHGLKHKSKKEYSEFWEIVLKLSKFLYTDIEKLMKETKFPKFDL
ncbi:MAG: TIGR02710 family CRISPR-associated protein [Methanobrevibacter sp.]|jgi:CRISPR-associated protein (TIGR02710 family)|nr:TIGR02710 family CRISPR-associated protein [Candidatus Methanovirga meridionalis]